MMSMIDSDILKFYETIETDVFTSVEAILKSIKNKEPELLTRRSELIDGKYRQLAVPSLYMKGLQKALARALSTTIFPQFSKHITGGIPKKSKEDTIRFVKKPTGKGMTMSLSWI